MVVARRNVGNAIVADRCFREVFIGSEVKKKIVVYGPYEQVFVGNEVSKQIMPSDFREI